MNIEFLPQGLDDTQVQQRREQYGENLLTPAPKLPLWKLYLRKFKDPIIIVLLVATVISLVVGIIHGDFLESVGIICAILLATGVGFWQEYDAQRKFDAMKSDKDYELVKVRRAGVVLEVTKDQLVVGDTVLLQAGDEIPADLKLFQGTDLKVSEAAMTGESVAVSKYPTEEAFQGSGFAPDALLRGTTLEQGLGEAVVIAVGDATEIGKTTRQATETTDQKTPLEVQLEGLADKITKAAFGVAVVMFVLLNIVHWIHYDFVWDLALLQTEMRFLMGAVVVVIVAVPEGLPLSVTLALAFSMKTMADENNLVKKMHACETIGAVNVIFTDKTGTLTQNAMTVVETHLGTGPDEAELFLVGALNSSANWSKGTAVIGNPTDSAILKHVGHEQTDALRKDYEVQDVIPFSSQLKYMVTAVQGVAGIKILLKGAPEVVARLIGQDAFLTEVLAQQARGRRAIAAAVIDTMTFEQVESALQANSTLSQARFVGAWFIEDPIRSDVPEAIEKCYGAGIDVVMMTGDNFKTGSEIARQAGFKDLWAIEAKDFHTAIQQPQQGRLLPNVIARCTPQDKLEILKWAQGKGYVCAMTGDGVNDSPSLNYADVGIAMGSGTSVAKEAADIVLLDDAFPSIVTGVKWGRSLFKNIKNFLFFQLTINVSACLTAVFGPLVGVEMPFTVIQFLWINLVMDSFAAIALASEPADERVLSEQPRDKSEFIINASLAKAIFGFGGFVFLLCTFVLWAMNQQWGVFTQFDLTMFFASYMILNWWNIFNARVIGKHKSIFDGIFDNKKFVIITAAILIITMVIVQIGGEIFQTRPLSLQTWGWILLLTSPVVIVREAWFWITKKS